MNGGRSGTILRSTRRWPPRRTCRHGGRLRQPALTDESSPSRGSAAQTARASRKAVDCPAPTRSAIGMLAGAPLGDGRRRERPGLRRCARTRRLRDHAPTSGCRSAAPTAPCVGTLCGIDRDSVPVREEVIPCSPARRGRQRGARQRRRPGRRIRRTPTGWHVGTDTEDDLLSAMVLADLLAGDLSASGRPATVRADTRRGRAAAGRRRPARARPRRARHRRAGHRRASPNAQHLAPRAAFERLARPLARAEEGARRRAAWSWRRSTTRLCRCRPSSPPPPLAGRPSPPTAPRRRGRRPRSWAERRRGAAAGPSRSANRDRRTALVRTGPRRPVVEALLASWPDRRVVVRCGDFLRPASVRLERGRDDPDAFYDDWVDWRGAAP